MADKEQQTFIVDCHICKAKVAAIESGRAVHHTSDAWQNYGKKVFIGNCPQCDFILVGESDQLDFKDVDSYDDRWSEVIRVYPKPPKTFLSLRIPPVVTDSLKEADRTLQAGANIATCMMLGRAIEALCRDVLNAEPKEGGTENVPAKTKKYIMLGQGIKELHKANLIDDRLYKWSEQLHAFRNMAAHPEDITISRNDAEDLQKFVYAMVEYVYDLTDLYDDFMSRVKARTKG
ncbi:DUF4145 domain-containing protein [Glaciimonas sp. PAMC28666]|uniref:DUF4145 domain-containing protein n=1 Tax=Glaciimonas sp. PAMC28666 TaxID=2807626 RepID=UPI0019667791|nr:DUF4145 domain-containing protein [Glaciimonas sp. PAMC28666]QRX82288.1 DUF4145 domain-containing protein [Glaciimonas sp. PAMC28666]